MHDLTLHPHPSEGCAPAVTLSVRTTPGDDGDLTLSYRLVGALSGIMLPGPAAAAFADNLWQHTCFEAFIASDRGTTDYREFNFSPSGEWAVYDFTAYRQRNPAFLIPAAPRIDMELGDNRLDLYATLPAGLLPAVASPGRLWIGLCAVLEATDGSLSYRALHHAASKPDFHHRAGFVLEIADPRQHQEQS